MAKESLLKAVTSRRESLQAAVEEVLSDAGEGISEFDLLRRVGSHECFQCLVEDGRDQLGLFQRHFLLFHVLYRLQHQAWEDAASHVEISPQCIRRLPYRPGLSALQMRDPLSQYYLDLENLAATSQEDVRQMLNSFWERYLAGEGREDALAVLKLKEPVTRAAIEKRYREMAARHHPDRGGDVAKQAEINKAVGILRQYYTQ